MNEKTLRNEIFQKVKELNLLRLEEQNDFIPSNSYIPYTGRVYDEKEIISLVDSALDFWLTSDRFVQQFETEFAEFLGM